jgi:hypothetical protein
MSGTFEWREPRRLAEDGLLLPEPFLFPTSRLGRDEGGEPPCDRERRSYTMVEAVFSFLLL